MPSRRGCRRQEPVPERSRARLLQPFTHRPEGGPLPGRRDSEATAQAACPPCSPACGLTREAVCAGRRGRGEAEPQGLPVTGLCGRQFGYSDSVQKTASVCPTAQQGGCRGASMSIWQVLPAQRSWSGDTPRRGTRVTSLLLLCRRPRAHPCPTGRKHVGSSASPFSLKTKTKIYFIGRGFSSMRFLDVEHEAEAQS